MYFLFRPDAVVSITDSAVLPEPEKKSIIISSSSVYQSMNVFIIPTGFGESNGESGTSNNSASFLETEPCEPQRCVVCGDSAERRFTTLTLPAELR